LDKHRLIRAGWGGVQLFHRGQKGVTLTAAGERLLPYAIKVTHLIEEAQKAVKDDGKPRGRLTIGSLETTAALRLSSVLAAYRATYPKCGPGASYRDGTSELVEQVLDHTVEGAL
jgi:LysR family transcriptional regulator, cell division regulator